MISPRWTATAPPRRDLYAIGPMLRGQYWETNAVPEIAVQAEALARRLWRTPRDHENLSLTANGVEA